MPVDTDTLPGLTPFALPGLTTRRFGRFAFYLPQVGSTNTVLKEAAPRLPSGAACAAGVQTAGRGRMGRAWVGEGKDLPFSLLIRAAQPQPALALCCGIAVAEALTVCTGRTFRIKWPNDIICGDKKICGILCECFAAPDGGVFMICGIGVNLTQTAADFQRAGLPYGGSVEMCTGKRLEPTETAAAILNRLEPLYEELEREGFGALKPLYAENCVTLGRQVQVTEGGRTACGRAVDIRPDGSLLVAFGSGPGESLRPVLAGEASVRGLFGYVDEG